MPLPNATPRKEAHHRIIDMKAYEREDGLFDIEAHLVDTKPFDFDRLGFSTALPAGSPLHDLWVRMTVDNDFVVRDIVAASDVTPYGVCKEAESTLRVLIGERIERGWSSKVKTLLGGAASCTHLKEMLIPLATTALQGIRGLRPPEARREQQTPVPAQIDSCFAYDRRRTVVQWLWPEHHVADENDASSSR